MVQILIAQEIEPKVDVDQIAKESDFLNFGED